MHHSMGPATRTASFSGSAMLRRLGNRSEKTMNSEVTTRNEVTKPAVSARSGAIHPLKAPFRVGLSAPSPTMPPMMVMAFSPICTTVK